MKIFWFLKNRIILKTYYVFVSLKYTDCVFCKESRKNRILFFDQRLPESNITYEVF